MMKKILFFLITSIIIFSCKKEIIQYSLITQILPVNSGTVIPSSGSFENGQKITLTATPAGEYIFKNWSGDLSGVNNPTDLIISKNSNVTVGFEKRQYPLNLTIEGSGTVKEEVISLATQSNYPSGTTVKLTPQPLEGYVFDSWSGDLTEKTNPLTIIVSKAINLKANFIQAPIKNVIINGFSTINKTTSAFVNLNESKSSYTDFNKFWKFIDNPNEKISSAFNYFDFDKDGDVDFVFATTQYSEIRQSVYIIENKGNDTWALWKKLSGAFYWPRQSILGDYDGNGYVDFLVADQGFENPSKNYYPGAELGIVYFSKNNAEIKFISTFKEYNHAASSGDIDNDGDIDIVTLDSKYLNNGNNTFTKSDAIYASKSDLSPIKGLGYYHNSMADFDNDGKLDMVYGCSEIFGDSTWDDNPRKYNGRSRIYWNNDGNGNYYYGNSTVLPMTYPATKDTFAIVDDFKIIDFNNDGLLDLVNFRSCWRGVGYYIQFLKNNGNRTFSEVTESYLERYKYNLPNAKPNEYLWLVWIRFVDLNQDGHLDLIGREQNGENETLKWINDGNNHFK